LASELGHPGFRLVPVVIGFDDVPCVRDRAAALRLPELAMLSVMAHPELEIAEVAINAISQLPADRSRLYLDVIMMAVPAAIRQILEARMQGYEYQSDFARKYYGQGREEGRQEGREEGLRAAVVALARTKCKQLSDDDIAAIEAISDQGLLTELVTSLGKVRRASEARAALDRALAR
jgi:predicted transposase YdaD